MISTRFRSPFRVIAIGLAAILILTVVTSVILSLFYEKAVIRYMKKYLDEHLLTQISMDEINFTVFKGFPNASVEISNAVVLSGKDFTRSDISGSFSDTLLQANKILLQFDLFKFFNKEYELKKIEISGGSINVLFDKQNRHNLNIWKSPDTPGQKYSVNLRSIVLHNTAIRLISSREQLYIAALSERSNFKGALSADQVLSGEVRGSLMLSSLVLKEKSYVNNASVHLVLKIINSHDRFRISQGKLQLNKAVATLKGEYIGGKEKTIDLNLEIPKFGLDELISVLPLKETSLTRNLKFNGRGNLNLHMKGSLTHRNNLQISSSFELKNGSAHNTHTNRTASNINLKGTIAGTNSSNFHLQLDQVYADLGRGKIEGSLELNDLHALHFSAIVQTRIDLEALKDFAGIDTLEMMTGFVNGDFYAVGSLRRLSPDSAALGLSFIRTGSFVFEEVGIKPKGVPVSVDHISGRATWGKDIRFDSLALRVNETELFINGNVENLMASLFKRDLLKATIEVRTDNLDINKYLHQPSRGKSNSDYKSLSIFPSNIYLKARVKAKDFSAGKFKASDVTFDLMALKDSVFINNFNLKFPDGSITGNALILGNADNMISVICNAQPKKINIRQLFTACNNFAQHFIVDKNIKGLLTGTVSFSAKWDSTLKIVPQSVKAKGDFEITNGELVEFGPMMKLSKYIDVEELKHIRFKTLKNSIYINEKLVTIPEMAINSTAFNIKVSGQHSFANVFDYRLKVLLSEVLFNKARKKKKEIDEFLVEESRADQTTIPLIISGKPDDFDVRLDKKRAFSITRDNINDEAPGGAIKPASNNFKIEWEEPEEKENKPVTREKADDSDFNVEWEE